MAHTGLSKPILTVVGVALCALAATQLSPAQTSQTPAPGAIKKQDTSAASATTAAKQSYDDLEFKGFWRHNALTNTTAGDDFIYTRADSVTTGDHGSFKEVNAKNHEGILDVYGNLVYDDPKHHATCNKGHIDMTAKLAVFTESVVLTLKPETDANGAPQNNAPGAPTSKAPGTPQNNATVAPPDNAAAAQADNSTTADVRGQKKHGVIVHCDRMEDQYKKKYIKLYGHVVFTQKYVDSNGKTVERELTAEHAEYNGKSEIMVLFGPVDGHDGNGQEIHNLTGMKIGTKEGAESMEGTGVKLRFLPQEDNEDDNSDADASNDGKPSLDSKATDTKGADKNTDAGKTKDGKADGAKGKS
jgi:hypothetical protein